MMLEHSAAGGLFSNTPPHCDEGDVFPDFYTNGLGSSELQDPVWAKMNSALTTGATKKRKKNDTKPQAQINKCQNEKRRREQENIYIEELAELISANFADMSSISVKPDKCAILQETVNQIRSIKQRESSIQPSDPVQQGEVSSSRPTILSNEIYGPLLLEALEGFLFVVNSEGRVEHITENVSTYINFTRDEVLGNSIYNFIHHGDHTRFSSCLLPMSLGCWINDPGNKSRSFSCRLLVKSDVPDETIEEKQQRVTEYEFMNISSTPLRQNSEEYSTDSGPCLLCVASRITYRDKIVSAAAIEQFTTKLDTSGKIIGVDGSGLSMQYSQYINKDLMGSSLLELSVPQELHKLTQIFKETLSVGHATSEVYKLNFGRDNFIRVQTKYKLFKPSSISTSTDSEFVMATHSIVSDDCTVPSDPGGPSGNNVGGPLMTSVVNGTRNGAPTSSGSDSSTTSSNNLLNNAHTSSFNPYTLDDSIQLNFPEIFPSSTWDPLDSSNWTEVRPDSRQSIASAPTPTPRPPSAPAFSPATTIAQSPHQQFAQPSPTIQNPSTPYSNSFTYSPMAENNYSVDVDQKPDTKVNIIEENTIKNDSARLRNLLTKPTSSESNESDNKNKHTILKGLLNQPDDEEARSDIRESQKLHTRNPNPGTSELPKTSTASGGMLLQLLNEKSDDDDVEVRAGFKKRSELFQGLMKEEEERKQPQSHSDTLLQSLGFTSSPSPPGGESSRGRKRPSEDRDDGCMKKSVDGSQVSSSGSTGSKLCEKNKMLAMLLAKTPSNHQPIPPVPASVISATPQEILPRINDATINKSRAQSINTRPRMPGRPPNTNYLNQMLSPDSNLQRNHNRQFNNNNNNNAEVTFAAMNTESLWSEQSSDPLLSIILDQVIDIVPDAVMTNPNDIQTLLDAMSPQINSIHFQQNEPMTEKMAINIIQKSLMQCESAMKSPSSPNVSTPASSGNYSTNTVTQTNQMSGFPPPPNYPRMGTMQRLATKPGSQQYTLTNQQLLVQQQRKQLLQQQQQENKRRLLERQSQQQLLIPSNATTAEMNPGMQNIENLMNNSVAPNVSLQRSSSVPESQLSPNYQISQPNQRISAQQQQQQPYSPHSQLTSPINQQANFTQNSNFNKGATRLSPHPPFNQQLSPRQGYPQPNSQSNNWQQNTSRLSVQQQQNPMLNAQLTNNYGSALNNRGFALQRQQQQQQQSRAIGSPGTVNARHTFQNETFQSPVSPNSPYNQAQFLRLQRTNSAPTATTQLPGGLGTPWSHPSQINPSLSPNPQHPPMYQQESQYCYDQTSLQLTYGDAEGERVPSHHQAGTSSGGVGPASEYVRQELRAVVGARTGQQVLSNVNTRAQNQQILSQNVSNSDMESLGLNFELPTSGASESPKLWGAMGSDMGSMSPAQAATSRNTMEEERTSDHKSSLLQKLLSE